MFWDFHYTRDLNIHGIEPLKPERIEAHLRLSRTELSPWQYKLLLQLDLAYRAASVKNQEVLQGGK